MPPPLEIVYSGKRRGRRAAEFLRDRGITCGGKSHLRVASGDAERARELLRNEPAFADGVMEAGEAAWWQCHACGEDLHGGETYCPACNAFVGA
jgi:rubrerythrin